MLSMNDLKVGSVFGMEGEPFVVLKSQHVQMGRGSAVLRTKVKNLLNGNVLEKTFKHGDKFDNVQLKRKKASYLYADESGQHFMDSESYEQFSLEKDAVEGQDQYLVEGEEYDIMTFNGKSVSLVLPKKVTLAVTETEPGVRGDTAQGSVSKPAIVQTGYRLAVPLFVDVNDRIVINTETGDYVERAA